MKPIILVAILSFTLSALPGSADPDTLDARQFECESEEAYYSAAEERLSAGLREMDSVLSKRILLMAVALAERLAEKLTDRYLEEEYREAELDIDARLDDALNAGLKLHDAVLSESSGRSNARDRDLDRKLKERQLGLDSKPEAELHAGLMRMDAEEARADILLGGKTDVSDLDKAFESATARLSRYESGSDSLPDHILLLKECLKAYMETSE